MKCSISRTIAKCKKRRGGGERVPNERELVKLLGESELKDIGEQLAEVVRQHGLQKSPDVCRKLFRYMADVVDGWNCV